jgi:hypothetical protein
MAFNSDVDFISHDLHDNDWLGIITSITDTTFSGRAQINVFGLFDGIDPGMLPWAYPINSTIFGSDGAGSLSVPKVGQIVRVQFNNGDLYAPEYNTIQNIDTNLINRIKDDYEGTHVLLYDSDQDLTVIFQKGSGFQIFYKESFFQITPDTLITLQTPNTNAIIQMDNDIIRIVTKNEIDISGASRVIVNADEVVVNGNSATKVGPGPYNHAVAGETLIALLATMAASLDQKLPSTPGVNQGIVEAAKQSILSTNVYISI